MCVGPMAMVLRCSAKERTRARVSRREASVVMLGRTLSLRRKVAA